MTVLFFFLIYQILLQLIISNCSTSESLMQNRSRILHLCVNKGKKIPLINFQQFVGRHQRTPPAFYLK